MDSISKIFKERLIANHLSKFTRDNIPDFERKWKKFAIGENRAFKEIWSIQKRHRYKVPF